MARPATKADLIKEANEQYNKMQNFINSITKEEQEKTSISVKKQTEQKRIGNVTKIFAMYLCIYMNGISC